MKVGDSGGSSSSVSSGATNKTADSATANQAAKAETSASDGAAATPTPAVVDRSDAMSGANPSETLERDPESLPSDPVAARDVVDRQADVASVMTGQNLGAPSVFDEMDTPAAAPDNPPGPELVEDPIRQEQRADLQTPEAFQPGSAAPEFPDFADQTPASSKTLPDGGKVDTFERDGVTYTRTTGADGSVRMGYQQDGTDYSRTSYEDGRTSVEMAGQTGDVRHTRTIETSAEGEVTDRARSVEEGVDADGNPVSQSREETLGPDGTRTISEGVTRPDGGTSALDRVEKPDGTVDETYAFEGGQGTVRRTTAQAADGSAQTRTERNYQVDTPLETVLAEQGVETPPVPDSARGQVVGLPEGERSDTSVRELEVVSTDPSGQSELQYAEQSYSQSSGDVTLRGSDDPATHDPWRDTFPAGIAPDNENSEITRTVTRVVSRDDDGNLVEATGASQTLRLEGDRIPEFGSEGEVSVTRTDSWNSAGESAETFQTEGFQQQELFGMSHGTDDSFGRFSAEVGGRPVSAGYPREAGAPFDHYNLRDGLQEWMGDDPSAGLDVGITVSRNGAGEVVSGSTTFDGRDADGNGKSVTRTEGQGLTSWSYSDYANDGQDYRRQTVFEGSDVSTYEESKTTGEGQFERMSETREGDTIIAGSNASRQEVSEDELRASVADGSMTAEQMERMLQDGPPYMVEKSREFAAALREEDGSYRRDEDGNPIQPGYAISSSTLSNGDGYSVSDFTRSDFQEDGGTLESALSTVTDPLADPPVTGTATRGERSNTGAYRETDSGQISVSADGHLTLNGEEVGQFDFGNSDLPTLLREGSSLTARELLAAVKNPAVAVANREQLSRLGEARFTLSGGNIDTPKLAAFADILGVVNGANEIFSGIGNGDFRQVAGGLGDMAGGFNSLAAATSVLAGESRLGAAAGRLSSLTSLGSVAGKVLGGVGGVASLGFGIYDGITGKTGYDRAGGWLGAAGGAVGVGSLFFGPPGWVVGGLVSGALGIASVVVSGADDNRTAAMDPRML